MTVEAASEPTVSVVLPTYNRAPLLGRAIRSVLDQTYGDFELLVVDDGSTDDTRAVVEGIADRRVVYVPLPANTGAGAARNAGIRLARGRFLAFQDSDDEWLPMKLAKQMRVFEEGPRDLAVVYCDMLRILTNGGTRYHASPAVVRGRRVNPITRSYQVRMLGIQATVIKRECLDAVGLFNEAFPALEDLELLSRMAQRYEFRHIKEPLVHYHETQGLSKNRHAQWLARKLLLRIHYKELLLRDPAFLLRECAWIYKRRPRE